MNAKGLDTCPICAKAEREENEHYDAAIAQHYGNLPVAEYNQLVLKQRRPSPIISSTLHQTLSASVDQLGIVHIDYNFRCARCNYAGVLTYARNAHITT